MTEPTHLYRAFAADGRLLYVGIAKNWPSRWTTHARHATFFADVARLDVETHPTRDDALAAERAAIKRERPAHNVVHNGRPVPARTAAVTDEAWENPQVAGTRPWTFASRTNPRYVRREPLWLMYELDYSPCIQDAEDDDDPLDYYRAYLDGLRSKPRFVELAWSVRGPSTMEVAPFDAVLEEHPDFPNFLRSYTWPVDDEGSPLHWYSLPVRCRFPELENALGWKPSPLQREVDFESLLRSLEARPDHRTVTARWEH